MSKLTRISTAPNQLRELVKLKIKETKVVIPMCNICYKTDTKYDDDSRPCIPILSRTCEQTGVLREESVKEENDRNPRHNLNRYDASSDSTLLQ